MPTVRRTSRIGDFQLTPETIREVRRQGVAIVWIEHIVHVLVQVAERLICMDGGKVIADGEPGAVMKEAVVIDAYLGSAAGSAVS